ncbi:hypothetical protein WJX72_007782 [[Myrmecia] bisecta]|uniref:Fungal lipase-type domain-containing protein n=1 Tax=[Myrmecia] bisecta TaxID=41462 RepID=A0AAW1PHJ5_9CHLO
MRHKCWSKRRQRVCVMNLWLLICMLVNVSCWLAANIFTLITNARIKELYYVEQTCLNTLFLGLTIIAHNANLWTRRDGTVIYRSDTWKSWMLSCLEDWALWVASRGKHHENGLILDAPLIVHAPKLLLWAFLQVVSTLDLVNILGQNSTGTTRGAGSTVSVPSSSGAPGASESCSQSRYALSVSILHVVAMSLYLFFYSLLLSRGVRDSWSRPTQEHRLGNLLIQLQARRAYGNFVMVWMLIVATAFLRAKACPSQLPGWVEMPINSFLTVLVATSAWLFMPRASDGHTPHVWLQEFAWTEAKEADKRARRARFLTAVPQHAKRASLDTEPMFNMETAIKLMYWAGLAYDIGEVSRLGRSVEVGLGLYSLREHVVIRSQLADAKVAVAWGPTCILLAFRGTASMTAAMHDLQAWLVPHPPARGSLLLGSRPRVHRGFLATWRSEGFREAVLARIAALLAAGCPPRFLITGHSLGGALATIGALDIAQAYPAAALQVYTYGAPRTGNHAFARAYEAAVPDTWSVINLDDPVTSMGKFACLYKRPGLRVMISPRGDMLVRPSIIEQRIELMHGRLRLKDHYLESYRAALAKVIKLQASDKALPDGSQGVLGLASSAVLQSVLLLADEQVADLAGPPGRHEAGCPAETTDVAGTTLAVPVGAAQPVRCVKRRLVRLIRVSRPLPCASSLPVSAGAAQLTQLHNAGWSRLETKAEQPENPLPPAEPFNTTHFIKGILHLTWPEMNWVVLPCTLAWCLLTVLDNAGLVLLYYLLRQYAVTSAAIIATGILICRSRGLSAGTTLAAILPVQLLYLLRTRCELPLRAFLWWYLLGPEHGREAQAFCRDYCFDAFLARTGVQQEQAGDAAEEPSAEQAAAEGPGEEQCEELPGAEPAAKLGGAMEAPSAEGTPVEKVQLTTLEEIEGALSYATAELSHLTNKIGSSSSSYYYVDYDSQGRPASQETLVRLLRRAKEQRIKMLGRAWVEGGAYSEELKECDELLRQRQADLAAAEAERARLEGVVKELEELEAAAVAEVADAGKAWPSM